MSHYFAQPSPAPGRDAPAAPAAPAGTAQEGAPPAKDSGSQSLFGGPQLLFLVIPFALLLFMSRNNNKKQKQLEESLKVGDKVVTQAGLLGRITEMDARLVKLEIAPGVKVDVLKSTVQGKYNPEAAAPAKDEKKDDKKDAKDEKKDSKDDKPLEKRA